jgi:Sulfotransferase domain
MERVGAGARAGGAMSRADNAAAPVRTEAGIQPRYRPSRLAAPQPPRTWLRALRDPKTRNPAIKQAARLALVAARKPTSGARLLPGFLIVGAQRSGTTSLARTLGDHPAVFGAVLHEEVHFFDVAYQRGLAWYRSHFPLAARARLRTRAAEVVPVAFESSPYYMFHPLAAERIARDLPGVRLLVLLRDPVERAYSGHAHEVAHGFEREPFEAALELEASRLAGYAERIAADPGYFSYSHQHHSYIARGEYVDQLERLERHFGRKRLHVVDSGDFFTEPEATYDRVLAFLGLPNRGYPSFRRRNAQPRSPMPASVRAALEEHYRPYDERLAVWLGREPSWRRGQ